MLARKVFGDSMAELPTKRTEVPILAGRVELCMFMPRNMTN